MKLLIIICILCAGCTVIPQKPKELCKIILERGYRLGVYDCSNMSYDLCVELEKLDYDCRIIVYEKHAIVEIIKNGHAFYYDPSVRHAFVSKPNYKIKEVWTVRQLYMLQHFNGFAKDTIEDYTDHLKK